ncbi:MAG: hypothetical protein M0P39_06760 [Rhodocyclaceae bacterium]|nr:hypothetical protein [Rhodocyclaceae bacterium]
MLPAAPIAASLVAALNHLLGQSAWARDRLRGFAGRRARLSLPPLSLDFSIDTAGLLAAAANDGAADVTIDLPADTPLRLLRGGSGEAMKGARIAGAADLADTLGFVLRNLRWDAEEDLSKVVGDIAAHRLVRGAEAFAGWQKDAAARLAENLAEYLSEESRLLVPRGELDAFAGDLQQLRERLERLERLERQAAARPRR